MGPDDTIGTYARARRTVHYSLSRNRTNNTYDIISYLVRRADFGRKIVSAQLLSKNTSNKSRLSFRKLSIFPTTLVRLAYTRVFIRYTGARLGHRVTPTPETASFRHVIVRRRDDVRFWLTARVNCSADYVLRSKKKKTTKKTP